eukprot:CAMPEP_0171246016 /NCGR_PEP_ID=MMETSP0790-20130122/47724_1 /TAXON_ID=2925 /ORGANISM="Alexandrium catenella, Strain OF101" /LENGTH=43 /DNA_ID= /DNA_START= /DNA_END= /DNA_ORIENTATION=
MGKILPPPTRHNPHMGSRAAVSLTLLTAARCAHAISRRRTQTS